MEPSGPRYGMTTAVPSNRPARRSAERLLGLLERVGGDAGADRHLRREREELVAILAGEVGDRHDLALPVEIVVGEASGCRVIWIPAQTTLPPGARAFSACGTSSPAEAKMIAASSSSGGSSSLPPAQLAPRLRANSWVRSSPGRVKANTSRPCQTATWQIMCAAEPKP